MPDFGKLNFAVAFNPQTAFPLDARYYFSSLEAAQAAAAGAVEVGSSTGTYFYGENVVVVTETDATMYVIQPDKTLKVVGSGSGDSDAVQYTAQTLTTAQQEQACANIGALMQKDVLQDVQDNSKPISAAAVYTTVGNINALLESI